MHQAGDELIDRQREIACLREALLGDASAAAGQLALMEGAAGIGKTSLLRVACHEARRLGMTVLTARGVDLEEDLAFGVVRHLFEGLPGGLSLRYPRSGSDWPDAAWRAISDSAWHLRRDADPDLAGMLHGLYWWAIEATGAAATLIAVDDAQWCDVPSLHFLRYLAHRLDGLNIRMLLTTRRGVATGSTRHLLTSIKREPHCRTIIPRPLDVAGVRRFVGRHLHRADDAFAGECLRLSGGNPFLLAELVLELQRQGKELSTTEAHHLVVNAPDAVRAATVERFSQLPSSAAAIARAVAVLGDTTVPSIAGMLAGIEASEAPKAIDALVEAQILEDSSRLSFVHPLVRAAVLDDMGPGATAAAHYMAALMLARDDGPEEQVALHLLAAAPHSSPWVVEQLRAAAARANACGSPDIAVHYLERALAEPPDPTVRFEVLLELGVAEARAGNPRALQRLQSALQHATTPPGLARAALLLSRTLFMAGRITEAVTTCETAISQLAGADRELRLTLESELQTAARQDAEARAIALRRLPALTPDEIPKSQAGCLLLANLAIEEAIRPGSRSTSIRLAERALEGGHLLDAESVATLPLAVLTFTLAGEHERAAALWDDIVAAQRRQGDTRAFALSIAMRGYARYEAGDLTSAVTDIRTGLTLARDNATQYMTDGYATAWLVYTLIETGEHAAAEEELAHHAHRMGPSAPFTAVFLLNARGRLKLAMNAFDDACTDLEECSRRTEAWGVHGPALCRWQAPYALALHHQGEHQAAIDVAHKALKDAQSWGAQHVIVECQRTLGIVLGGQPGRRLLEQAVETARVTGSPLELAHSLLALGRDMRATGHKTQARPPLREAIDLSLHSGAHFLFERAQQELLATGARPRRLSLTGVSGLTTAERRVAQLAADGGTNREIAQLLFVSEKTVETHLRNCFKKLGITARIELRSVLADLSISRPRHSPTTD